MTHPREGARAGRAAVWAVVVLAGLVTSAAVAAAADASDEQPRFKTRAVDDATLERLLELHYTEAEDVRLVLLPASVTDRKGRVVRGLGREDFKLYDDQVLQEIKYFSSETREPISIAFLLDISGSMRRQEKLVHAKEAIRYFVDQLREGDRFGLICFADEQVVWVTELTGDRRRFLQRLEVQEGFGQTALNDAVAAAPGLVDDRVGGRKAIVLITDGIDTSSRLSSRQAVELARQVSVPIYTIGFLAVPADHLPKDALAEKLEILDRATAETGGRLFPVYDPAELKEAITYIDNELRFQYVLGYYPSHSDSDGSFRRVRVVANKANWTVRTRSGYYDQPEDGTAAPDEAAR
jgi:Ca-activated chloride channel family protein